MVALQIRDVPPAVRDVLSAQAAERNQSMQSYLLAMVEREARLVANAELFSRTAPHRIAIPEALAPEELVREGRDGGFAIDRHSDELE